MVIFHSYVSLPEGNIKYVKMGVYCYKWPEMTSPRTELTPKASGPQPPCLCRFHLAISGWAPKAYLFFWLWALKIYLATEVLMLPGRDGNVEMCLKMIQPSRQFLIVHSTWTFREFQRRHSGMSGPGIFLGNLVVLGNGEWQGSHHLGVTEPCHQCGWVPTRDRTSTRSQTHSWAQALFAVLEKGQEIVMESCCSGFLSS